MFFIYKLRVALISGITNIYKSTRNALGKSSTQLESVRRFDVLQIQSRYIQVYRNGVFQKEAVLREVFLVSNNIILSEAAKPTASYPHGRGTRLLMNFIKKKFIKFSFHRRSTLRRDVSRGWRRTRDQFLLYCCRLVVAGDLEYELHSCTV